MTFAGRGLQRTVGGRTLFADLDFEVAEGQVLCVRGASGAGKTLFLRQLAGLDPLEAGELSLDGRSPQEWGPQAWRAEVLYIPQQAPILAGTPAEFAAQLLHLHAQRQRSGDDPRTLAAGWGLAQTAWDQTWRTLSVGERQRALLATLLARRPRVLLLDEPTAALDPDALERVEESLAAETCVWVTHHPEQAARRATSILDLSDA
ncbi:MAG TPA: ABC transporter ATP-binding protein [Planctomycetes bacterium]|jgi:ABC-type cobalamin/Fe3+-siderophores transport system ATPase subunit|nr:ABC transporter ATP-binding protein [Planctomycetota bacterium]HIL51795.1 ABC transporter ATP-binding protein [Planctomycetota bacterium]